MADPSIETDQIQSAKTNCRIDDTGKPCEIAEQKGDKVKTENTDQKPVDGSDNDQG